MAVFEQERHVELAPGGTQTFFITNRMVSANIPIELPHVSIFVLSVANVLDPTQDTLARVATLADLTLVPIGRDAGIAAPDLNGTEYLSAAATSTYTDLQTATDAATAFQDRVNQLIEDWISFDGAYNAPDPTPALYTFPRTDASQLTALINAYTVAKQSRYQIQQTKLASDAALTAAQNDYVYKSNLLGNMSTLVTNVNKVGIELNAVVTQFATLLTAGNTFYAANTGGPGAATFAAALSAAAAQQVAMIGYLTDAATATTQATAYQTARQSDVNTSSAALTTAQATQITNAQMLTSALALEATALAAVLAVCPDFQKTSIPFVPDPGP